MSEILNLLPVLFCLVILNIALGMYKNIGIERFEFDWEILISGIIKAVIIAASFIGLAYCFFMTDLSVIGITPDFVINAAITIYAGKVIVKLASILGVNVVSKIPENVMDILDDEADEFAEFWGGDSDDINEPTTESMDNDESNILLSGPDEEIEATKTTE